MQTVGDLFAASVWILAIVILVVSPARLGADVRSLGPAITGFFGVVTLIVGEASSRFRLLYGLDLGSDVGLTIPGAFDDFGWRNTMQVLMWFTVVLAIALGMFLFPRLAGGWGLLTGALMVLVIAGAAPADDHELGPGHRPVRRRGPGLELRPPFAWTVIAFVLLAIGGVLALVAPDHDRDRG